jgi:hypothetical protein
VAQGHRQCLISLDVSFHREVNTVSGFRGFCTLCEASLLTTFRNSAWALYSLVRRTNRILFDHIDQEDGTDRVFRNVGQQI